MGRKRTERHSAGKPPAEAAASRPVEPAAPPDSQAHLSALFDALDDLVFVVDLDARILHTNAALRRRLGYSADELRQLSTLDLHAPHRREEVAACLEAMLRGETNICAIPMLTKDGRLLPVELRSSRGHWNGQDAMFAVARDLTEIQRFGDSEAHRDALLVSMGDAIALVLQARSWRDVALAVLARLGTTLAVSRAWLVEAPPPSGTQSHDGQCVEWTAPGTTIPAGHTPSAAQQEAMFARLLAGAAPSQARGGHVRDLPKLERCWWEGLGAHSLLAVPVVAGHERWGMLAVAECHREREWWAAEKECLKSLAQALGAAIQREQTESALRESEERYRLLADAMEDFVILNDTRAQRLYVSPSFYRATGFTPEEVQASDFRLRVHPQDLLAVERARAANLRGESTCIEYRCLRKGGNYFWLELRATPILGPTGAVEKILCCSRDISARKAAEEALHEAHEALEQRVRERTAELAASEARSRAIVAAALDFIAIVEADGTLRFLNRAPEYRGADELIGTNVLTLVHPESHEAVRRAIAQVIHTGQPTTLEVRDPAGPGQGHWYSAHLGPFEQNGHVTGVAAVIRDVTEQRRTEELLRLTSSAVEQSSEGVFVTDLDGRLRFANRAFAAMHGQSRLELVGRPLEVCHAAEQAPVLQAMLEEVRRTGMHSGELWHANCGGRDFPTSIHASLLRNEVGQPVGIIGIVQDITERKEAELALRASEERFRMVVQATHDAIYDWDLIKDSAQTNEYMETLLGTITPPASQWWAERVHPDDRARLGTVFAAAMQGNVDRLVGEYRFRMVNGEYGHVLDRGLFVRNAAGVPIRLIGAMTDLTARRATEARLRQAERLASIGTLAAGIAHEINNPTGMILVAAQSALATLDNAGSEAYLRKCLSDIVENARRCGRIVKSVLQFARQQPAERWPSDLNQIVRRATDLVRGWLRQRHATLTTQLAETVPTLLLNPTAFEQVLVNLVQNAVEAGGPGCEVRISTEGAADRAWLQVTDNGPGLAPDQLQRIFDPFFTTRQALGGTGLGLSIVHGIVEAHGGKIEVKSQPHEGTTFTIELPVRPGPRASRDGINNW